MQFLHRLAVLDAAFVAIAYRSSLFPLLSSTSHADHYCILTQISNHKFGDIDRLFGESHSILVFHDKDAISSRRPQAYIERARANAGP